MMMDSQFSEFTPDITPIMLAAHTNNYEIIKMIVQKGVSIPQPHEVRCNCMECVSSSDVDSLRHSRSRLNIYKALASPSLIALSSEDPFLTAFQLSWELQELSKVKAAGIAERAQAEHEMGKIRNQVRLEEVCFGVSCWKWMHGSAWVKKKGLDVSVRM